MRFLLAVIDTTSGSASTDEMAAIDEFNNQLRADGHWVFACGIDGPSTATVFDNRGGADLVTPGPLLASPDYVSGFWIVEAADSDVAHTLAAQGSRACNRRVELRPLLG